MMFSKYFKATNQIKVKINFHTCQLYKFYLIFFSFEINSFEYFNLNNIFMKKQNTIRSQIDIIIISYTTELVSSLEL